MTRSPAPPDHASTGRDSVIDYDAVDRTAAAERLAIFGAFHPGPDDGAPEACGTLLLLGPREPGFWAHVSGEAEFNDGARDPLDRWSQRVIGKFAVDLGAKALFPFGGPPWRPFISWAKRSGRAWESPVGLLVHDNAGLMVSFRGALAFRARLPLPAVPSAAPCVTCDQPCLTACPVGALGSEGYDLAACHAYLDTEPGAACRTQGCAVRRACPVSARHGRRPVQSAFHMRSFHR